MWENFILIWSIYSSFFTPMEFAFFNGLPRKLFLLDICGQIVFLVDIVIQFSVAYRDSQTYKMVYKRTPIALRLVSFSHKNIIWAYRVIINEEFQYVSKVLAEFSLVFVGT